MVIVKRRAWARLSTCATLRRTRMDSGPVVGILDQHAGDFFGAAHGATTRYVFGTLDGSALLESADRPGKFGYRVVDVDRAYGDVVRAYWVQFAKTGDPNGEGRPGWPAVSPGNDLILEFAQHGPILRRDYHLEPWRFFEHHFEAGKL